MVCLGFRQNGDWSPFHHLGRETFLVGVHWREDGWFEAGENGAVYPEMDIPGIKAVQNGMAFMMYPWTHLVKEIQDGVI